MYRYITALILAVSIQVITAQVTCTWQSNDNCINAAFPCSLTDTTNWVGGVAPMPASIFNYILNIDGSSSSSPQYILMNQSFGPQQIQLLNITGGVQFVIKSQTTVESLGQTILQSSQLTVYTNASFGDISLNNSTLTIFDESTSLNGYLAFDTLSTMQALNDAHVTITSPGGNLNCKPQFLDQSTLILQSSNDLVHFKAGLLSTNSVIVLENSTLVLGEGVSNLTNVNVALPSGQITLGFGSELNIYGPSVQVAGSIAQFAGSDLVLNNTISANIGSLQVPDMTSSTTLFSMQLSIGTLYTNGNLTVQSSNFVITEPSTIAQIYLQGPSTMQPATNITIHDIIVSNDNVQLTISGGECIIGQKTQNSPPDLDISIAKTGQLTTATNFNVGNGEILVNGHALFNKAIIAGNITMQDADSTVSVLTNQIDSNVVIIAGQLFYTPNQPLVVNGSLSIFAGEFVTGQSIVVTGSFNLGVMTLQIFGGGSIQVQSNLLLSPDTNIIYEIPLPSGLGNGAPIQVLGSAQLDGNINVVFTPTDYSATYAVLQCQSQITGFFAKLMMPNARYQSKVSITNGKPPNYVLVSFKQSSQQMAGWKIGLIVIGIMIGILAAGFGFLYYKRHDGYLRLNN